MRLFKRKDGTPLLYLVALNADLCEYVFEKTKIWLFIKIDGAPMPVFNLVMLHAVLFTNVRKSVVVLPVYEIFCKNLENLEKMAKKCKVHFKPIKTRAVVISDSDSDTDSDTEAELFSTLPHGAAALPPHRTRAARYRPPLPSIPETRNQLLIEAVQNNPQWGSDPVQVQTILSTTSIETVLSNDTINISSTETGGSLAAVPDSDDIFEQDTVEAFSDDEVFEENVTESVGVLQSPAVSPVPPVSPANLTDDDQIEAEIDQRLDQLPEPVVVAEEEEDVNFNRYPLTKEAVRQNAIEANRLGLLRWSCQLPEMEAETSSSGELVMVVPPTRPVATVRPMPKQTPEPEMPENPNDQTWGTWGRLHTPEEVERANFSVPFLTDVSYGSFASNESAADRFNNRSFNDRSYDLSDMD